MTETQISAHISDEAKAALETYVKRRGVKKAFVIEEALLHHLQALKELPEDIVIPVRLELSEKAMQEVAGRLSVEEEPSPSLKALFGN